MSVLTTDQPTAGEVPSSDAGEARATPRRRSWRRSLFVYLVTVFLIVTANFFLPRAMPGDPLTALQAAGSQEYVRDDATRAALSRYYKLDQPLVVQYGRYLRDMAHGNLGVSILYNRPVTAVVKRQLPWTALLIVTAMLIAAGTGILAGLHSGWRRDRPVDRVLLGLFLGFQNIPVFFVGSLALVFFAVKLGWFPLSGAYTQFADYSLVHRVLDIAHHLILPAIAIAVELAAYQYLVMRASMVSELGADYLLLGRAKGLRERRLKYRYAARNAMLPVVTIFALQLSRPAVAGAIFVERVFAYPGIGDLLSTAAGVRDYPLLQGCFLVLSLLVVTTNFLADLAYARLDPRTTA
jgi:peptide/nickel transport system permease protein